MDTHQMDIAKVVGSLGTVGILGWIVFFMMKNLPAVAEKAISRIFQLKDDFYIIHKELCKTFTEEQEAQRELYMETVRLERELCQSQFDRLLLMFKKEEQDES